MAKNILIVDDDPDILSTLRMSLEDENFSVLCAMNGEQALKIMQDSKAPLPVFLDVNMPRLDGLGVLREVQRNAHLHRHVITLLTAGGRTLQNEIVQLMRVLSVDIVWKPFDLKSITLAVTKMEQRLAIKR
ncbi:MAG: response regulator [Ktedonobacterales bacterium]|nr:response regulator [Ktedonobacterales bacterium]